MKKLITIISCFSATVVFCTQSWAGNINTNNNDPSACYVYNFEDTQNELNNLPSASTFTCNYCCIDGTNTTVVNCNTVVLGKTCAQMGCAAGDCPDRWSWSPSDGLSSTSVQKPTFNPACIGAGSGSITYTITAWKNGSNCCAQNTNTLTVTWSGCTPCRIGNFAQNEEKQNKNIGVFPNPSSGNVTVQFEKNFNDALLQVYDMQGALVIELIVNEQTMQIDLSKNPKGVYFIQVVKGKEGLLNKKIVIE
ncbi:MAG: T9SS type A sorting domain-containing protein [Bacteroidetes bacterium]|nr:T9SS type A sorting domain-containing protein [Bacteroidota bacterium]